MNTINTQSAQYGYLNIGTGIYSHFVNATSLSGAVCIWMKSIMKRKENDPIMKEDGTINLKATLQNWHNDYKAVVLENAQNDGQDVEYVSLDETADHLINTFGFVCENKQSISPSRLRPELLNLFNKLGIQE